MQKAFCFATTKKMNPLVVRTETETTQLLDYYSQHHEFFKVSSLAENRFGMKVVGRTTFKVTSVGARSLTYVDTAFAVVLNSGFLDSVRGLLR